METQEVKIGRVVNVSGSQVIMLLEAEQAGEGPAPEPKLQMGELVKMRMPDHTVFGAVTGLSIPIPSPEDPTGEMKVVELELLGEDENGADKGFQRGVSIFPVGSSGEGIGMLRPVTAPKTV